MMFEIILCCGIFGVFVVMMVVVVLVMVNVFGLVCGVGDICCICMYLGCIGESIDMVYWVDGKYICDVLNEINVFMCDWCMGQVIGIDLCIVDIVVVL